MLFAADIQMRNLLRSHFTEEKLDLSVKAQVWLFP
uniref:Uncharacterized protein n=1 Tax=Anguilla anguilla TaxID=7936 RepID=A0A0E9SPU1_ANGAN